MTQLIALETHQADSLRSDRQTGCDYYQSDRHGFHERCKFVNIGINIKALLAGGQYFDEYLMARTLVGKKYTNSSPKTKKWVYDIDNTKVLSVEHGREGKDSPFLTGYIVRTKLVITNLVVEIFLPMLQEDTMVRRHSQKSAMLQAFLSGGTGMMKNRKGYCPLSFTIKHSILILVPTHSLARVEKSEDMSL